jgi:hypothetical protein
MTWGTVRRLVVIAGLTTFTVCGVSAAAWAIVHRPDDGPPVPTYASARGMAHRAGCGATFRAVSKPADVQSAGECTVSGHVVAFRVQRVINTAAVWPTPGVSSPSHNYVGTNWIAHSSDLSVLEAVGARLAP